MKKTTKDLVIGAVIAALYVALTVISNLAGLGFGAVQLRISEAFAVLPVFTPAAIWGVTLGCFISNIMSFNPVDMIFGTVATLCAALITYLLKNVRIFKLPLLSMLAPVIINAAVVSGEIIIFVEKNGTLTAFLVAALWVVMGEIVTVVGLGGLLFTAINKNRKLTALLS